MIHLVSMEVSMSLNLQNGGYPTDQSRGQKSPSPMHKKSKLVFRVSEYPREEMIHPRAPRASRTRGISTQGQAGQEEANISGGQQRGWSGGQQRVERVNNE